MSADSELLSKLIRRQQLIDNGDDESDCKKTEEERKYAEEVSNNASDELKTALNSRRDGGEGVEKPTKNICRGYYADFPEFTVKQIKHYEEMFKKFDENKDKFICFEELKRAMEKLGHPQTHLALKEMIREIDEDKDGKINFREFLLLFRKAAKGELAQDSALSIFAQASEIDVAKEGVGKAKTFFDDKVKQLTQSNAFETEIRKEQEERKRLAEEKRVRREEFSAKIKTFS